MLAANAERADWRDVSPIVLHIDAEQEPDRAQRALQAVAAAGLRATTSLTSR